MKKIITLALIFVSGLVYSQSIRMIEDDKFVPKAKDQSVVLFKIRIIDGQARYGSEAIENGRHDPAFRISKYDESVSKLWDTRIASRAYIEDEINSGRWIKIDDSKYAYEWLYVLETKPRKSGYYFETLRWFNAIPVMRKIAPENGKLYNYGTLEITFDQEGKNAPFKLLDSKTEKEQIMKDMKSSYPNVYNAYIDKISDDRLKFFYTVTTVGELKMKYYYDYWSKLYGDGIDGQFNYGISINSKITGQSQQTHLSIGELHDLPHSYNISFKSMWKKGETAFNFGLIIGNGDNNKYFFHTTASEASGIIGTCNNSNSTKEVSNKEAFPAGKTIKEKHHRIEIRGKHAIYFINDIRIADFELNDVLSKNCFVGFLVEDKQKVFFDEFQISEQ